MLNHLSLFLKDTKYIFMKRRNIKQPWRLFVTNLRIKFKLVFAKVFSLDIREEHALGLTFVFPEYGGFVHLWREIFILENYYFETEVSHPYIVDAGSNTGVSILFFKYVFPDAEVIGFEPDPETFKWLQLNIAKNNLQNVIVHNVALGDREGTIPFYRSSEAEASAINSTKKEIFHDHDFVTLEVPVKHLSSFFSREVDALKIDTEGAEHEILADLKHAGKLKLAKNIFLEVHQGYGPKNESIGAFLSILEEAGFRYAITDTFIAHHAFENDPLAVYAFIVDAERIG